MGLRGVLAAGVLTLTAAYALAHPQPKGAAPPPVAAKPLRVSSTTLCGDLWLMALADRDQIVSVSQNATGPYSPYADKAKGLPKNRGSLEELIAGDAQLVVTGHGTSTQMQRMLPRFGIRELDLPMVSDFAELADKIPQVGEKLGQPARARALQTDFRRSLAQHDRAAIPGPKPVVAYYRPDGGGAGAGTFVDAAISAAGFDNMQRRSGPPGWRGVPLEQIVMTPPDAFVVSYFDTQKPSLKAGLGRNPVLRKAAQNGAILPVPGKLWPCDHPVIADAVTVLAHARDTIRDARP